MASTSSEANMSVYCSKTWQCCLLSGAMSASASARAFSSESAMAATTATCSPSSAMLRMCSLPMAPVPMMPTRRGLGPPCAKAATETATGAAMGSATSGSGRPRSEARTRRGGMKVSRECMTSVLSMNRMSPFFHVKTTRRSSMNFATAHMISLSTGEPSPSSTAFSPTFRASFQPVKAAIMELKKTRLPVRWSTRSAGKTAVTVLQSPLGSHSQVVPCFRIAASASARVVTLYVSFQERP
mmetsp:Transcript_168894/g.542902  ORF Transcript_168894/g.542902 Transcript_168894/m.542902 type:complete len:241 (-) Transcript_168894:653-1375(-)